MSEQKDKTPMEPFPFKRKDKPKTPPRSGQQGSAPARPAAKPTPKKGAKLPFKMPKGKEDGDVKLIGQSKKDVLKIVLGSIAAALIISFITIPILADFLGLNQPDVQAQVVVNEGDSVSTVLKNLKKTGVIKYPTVFKLYLGLSEKGYQFKAGEYVLNSNLSFYEIIIMMRKVNISSATVSITFWEGMTQKDIANLLEEKGVCTAAAFHKYLDTVDITTLPYEFVNLMPEGKDVFRPLEGYLFPDTYEFFVGEKPATVANKFLARFDAVIDEDMYALMKERNMTLADTITLASIIEKECSDTEEAGRVSGVFHNRLDKSSDLPKLQSDVTIFYVNQDIKPFLDKVDQPLYDRYNTYVCTGLPVGPICNPGLATIKAALTPVNSDDYFFFSDSEGAFFYSETFEIHTAKLAKTSGDVVGIDTPKN